MTEIQQSPPAVLSEEHRAYLHGHGISDEIITAASLVSENDWLVFPWRDGDLLTRQRRRWPEPPDAVPSAKGTQNGKYLWEAGEKLHLAAWRPAREDKGPVILAEGTKQSLAVASHAPPEYAVYGMAGCWGWKRLDLTRLDRFAGRQVLIILDADAGGNLDVYEAGENLATELATEGADPVFVPFPAQGKDGIDDYLAMVQPAGRRQAKIAGLIDLARSRPEKARGRPAERKPAHRKVSDQLPDTADLPLVVVNKNRRDVVNEILWHMKSRWNQQLFSYGGAITRLRGTTAEPLDRDSFTRWMSETVATYRYKPPGQASPGQYEAAWPEPQTIGALLASGDEFPELNRITRTPFARDDGSICAKNGYDAATGTVLVTGNSGMDRLDIPDAPSREEAAEAARFLLGTSTRDGDPGWLGDMPWKDRTSQADALALVLTPFIRGLVPLVPLAVISGLQMGVGKNLLADCISLMLTGQSLQTMPWIPDDDDENRKQILSAFRAGVSMYCLDEAHHIDSHALARAITSVTYSDRILGISKQAAYPNTVTWLALGNHVIVDGDMSRRYYLIELYPPGPDPQDRPESAFRHPDLRTWTLDNRPELVTCALVMIRAWYAAGQPAFPRGSLMGSFEPWDKIVSGILGYAGVDGFLGNLTSRRAERDTTGGYWTEHLTWLRGQFGGGEFTLAEVQQAALNSGGAWEPPPRLDNIQVPGFARMLGQAYARVQDRWFARYRIVKTGTGHGKIGRWAIETLESGTLPELGGRRPEVTEVTDSGAPGPNREEVTEVTEETPTPTHTRARAHDARSRAREGGGTGLSSVTSVTSAGNLAIAVDLETDDASRLFLAPRGAAPEDGGFVRLAGAIGPGGSPVIASANDVLAMTELADRVDTHNGMGFDGLALVWHHGADWHQLAAKIRDTELIMRQVDPPRSRETGGASADRYDLDHVAERLGVAGKTDDLARLARKHGGYGAIPLDDPEYRGYLEGDLRATAAVSAALMPYYDTDPYIRREHRLAELAGQMRLNGFHVDQPLLDRRVEQADQAKADAARALHDGWGLPLSKTVTRGRGKARHEEQEPMASPLSTDTGRDWLASQWSRYGVASPPLTDTGKLALGTDALAPVAADPGSPEDLRQMLALMKIITTARTVYQTAADWLCPDGRVHPKISMRQASGRWSFLDPGLTVYGKHAGRHVERDIFLPDEGELLVSFDLSQVDMRAMAGHCQDPAYMAMFGFHPDGTPRDPHTEIGQQVGLARQDAKMVGHGWNYGLSVGSMIRKGMDPEKVYGFDNGMREQFGGLISWREAIREMGKAGQILGNGFGRRMRCDPGRAYTVAPALMGQGGARDIMCECLLRLPSWTWPMLRAMVHDEVILSVPPAALREVVRAVTAAMTWTWAGVPILCDINGPGLSWGEISGKCRDCGKGAHGQGFCGIYAELTGLAASMTPGLLAAAGYGVAS